MLNSTPKEKQSLYETCTWDIPHMQGFMKAEGL